jgi:hypothetical protein
MAGRAGVVDDFAIVRDAGSWSVSGMPVSIVPAPIVGSGLPGLIAASASLLAWGRRKRKAQAIAASV